MLLLKRVLSHEAGETCCEGELDADLIAACGGEVSAVFGLEMIAQATAVHSALAQTAGGLGHVRAGRGLLLGSRRLQLGAGCLPTGESLRVTVFGGAEPPGPGGLIRFTGRVEDDSGRILASGDATVLEMRPDPV